jgi:5'-nucleotidase
MRVLVTNDDGVESPGLHALATALQAAEHDVFVVAPSGERSGSGAAIGRLHRAGPIAWREVEWPGLPGVPVHAVDVPPAAAVYAGCLGAFGDAPDVVASGINPGLNYGHLVIHSGTVGAALTAQVLGVPGVAVSIGWSDDEQQWPTAASLAAAAVGWAGCLAEPKVLNLNVPNVPLPEVRGVRAARTGPFNERWSARAGGGELQLEYEGHTHEPEPDTDIAIVHQGYAAVAILTGIADEVTSAPDAAAAIAESIAAAAASPDAAA